MSSNISFEDSIVAPLIDFRQLGYKTSVAGYSHVKHVQFTDIHRHLYEKVFKLFDNLGLNYFVFAGALVGYVRNGELPPWMDDMDVMIFEEFPNGIVFGSGNIGLFASLESFALHLGSNVGSC